MLTALTIEEHSGGLLRFLRKNRIRVDHRFCDSASLKCVTYEHYRGRIGWNTIDRFVKAQRNRVLCPPDLALPENSGYKRFVSYELSRRLCENTALYLLRSTDCRGVKVVLIDDSGDSVGVCEYLTDHCDPLYVISDVTDIYAAQAEYLLNEKGAALRICRSKDCLCDADLIIAPDKLTRTLPCPDGALILTAQPPAVPQSCLAVYDYYFDLPSKYRELCPVFLDGMYFASALYATNQARELGSELFTRCGDGTVLHTRQSLLNAFKNRSLSP
ncbi:MAG: hypothetical protein IJH07_09185 [Ruminococcus sp.]|nr:hypothetical protein [Ruminococcus sp.]